MAGTDSFAFRLNGESVEARSVSVQTTLLDYIRTRNLTGAKEGCAEGECGACAVVVVDERAGAGVYRAVNSCLLFLPMIAGRDVYTVESLSRNGQLHVVQQAIADNGGSQCGFCTPGFVMSLFAEHYRPDRTGACDVHALSGNLCRCTGYRPIRDAVASLGPGDRDEFSARLSSPQTPINALSYEARGVLFSRPDSLSECFKLLEPGARLVAGNTDLGIESNLKMRKFQHLVSVEAVPELRVFRENDASVEIGAALALDEIEARWTSAPNIVREWFPLFASPLIRNRATLGGNLATASPIGDAAPMLLALDAQVKIADASGTRYVPLDSFFTGYRETILQPGAVIVSVVIPKPFPAFARFFKAAKRRMDDISTVAAAFAITFDADRIHTGRIAFGGVAAQPVRLKLAEEQLIGRAWNRATMASVQQAIARSIEPMSDHRGSAAYRLALAQSLFEKFWIETEEVAA
jgi:xanthine dehydrogenase small subunit